MLMVSFDWWERVKSSFNAKSKEKLSKVIGLGVNGMEIKIISSRNRFIYKTVSLGPRNSVGKNDYKSK